MSQLCEECKCLAMDLYTLPDGRRLCDFCSTRALLPVKVTHNVRVYSNTQYAIKQKYGTIAKWCKIHHISPVLASASLKWKGTLIQKGEDKYTKKETEMLVKLLQSGFTQDLLNDGLISEDWL